MDVSNKTMALLLLVAVAVSFLSTTVSLDRLGKIDVQGPTARAPTDTGVANLTIQALVSINFDVDTINFGTGYIIGGAGNCVLDTNSTSNASPNDRCAGFNVTTTPFIINNTGNTDARLDLDSTRIAANFTGGTGSEQLQWWMVDNEGDACSVEGSIFRGWRNINMTTYTACGASGFESDPTADTIALHMRVLIPQDATEVGTQRIVTITGTAQ